VLICTLVAAVSTLATGAASAATPAATTGAATAVGPTTATLNATVFPNQDKTSYHFEYGTTTAYGARTPDAGPVNGNAGKAVAATITGLAPSTTYHFRVVATNASGTAFGADLTFTTTAGTGVTIAAKPRTVTFGRSTTIAGQVAGAGAGTKVELQQTPFPFMTPFATALSGATDAAGAYAFTVAPRVNTKYHVEAKASPTLTSPDVIVNVRVRVGLRLSDRTPRIGQRVRFYGTVLPAHDGRAVSLQRRTRTGWKTIARPVLKPAKPLNGVARSKYSTHRRVYRSRTYRTVFRPRDGDHVRGTSPKRRARVH
jgi:hypothetical protein